MISGPDGEEVGKQTGLNKAVLNKKVKHRRSTKTQSRYKKTKPSKLEIIIMFE